MSLAQFSDKVRQIFDFRDYCKHVLPSIGTTSYDSSMTTILSSKMVSVFGAPGLIISDFYGEAGAFAAAYKEFLLDNDNLDLFASQPFVNGTAKFRNNMPFISSYFRVTPPSQSGEFDKVSGAIRFMSAVPEPITFENMLNQLVLPSLRMPSALNSYLVSPDQLCNVKTPIFNLSARMQMARPEDGGAGQICDSHVELGENAVYLVFRHNAGDQAEQINLLCDLTNTGNIGNLHAASVKIECVNEIEGKYIPRACVPGMTNNLRPSLQLPVTGGNAVFETSGVQTEQFHFATGQATLTIPFAVPSQRVLGQSYVIVKISGTFLTSGCGINDIFAERNYSARTNLPGFPNLIAQRTIFRTSTGCAADSPSMHLDTAFRAIFERAWVNYRTGNQPPVAPVQYDVSMFNFPEIMRNVLGNIAAEGDQRITLQKRLAFLRHMYVVSLILYGLGSFTV